MTEDGELPLVRRSGKSDSAFRTISEVADELDVPQHVLRFWESKFPQVKPLKRGGGRRYYRPEDVALLRRIRDLLYSEGYTIKGVQKLLREGGARELVAAARGADVELPLPATAEVEVEMVDEPQTPTEDMPELDDGEAEDESEEGGALDVGVAEAPAMAAFPPETRRELRALLVELEQLRGLLQPR